MKSARSGIACWQAIAEWTGFPPSTLPNSTPRWRPKLKTSIPASGRVSWSQGSSPGGPLQFGVYARLAGAQRFRDGFGKGEPRRDRRVLPVPASAALQTTAEQHTILLQRGPDRLSPFMIPMLILNMASGLFSMYYKLRGPNFATCSACATSSHAIGEAWRTIKMGDAQAIFAGGAEATIVPIGIGGFCAMRAMSTRNDDPKRSSRPFDKERDGFVMGGRRGRAGAGRVWNTPKNAVREFIAKSLATETPPTRTT